MIAPKRQALLEWKKQLESEWPGSTDGESFGYAYVMECNGFYKIGHTTDIPRRLSAIQVANVKPVKLICWWMVMSPEILESELHLHFQHKKTRGEWHELSQRDVALLRNWADDQSVPTYLGKDRDVRESKLGRSSPYHQIRKNPPDLIGYVDITDLF